MARDLLDLVAKLQRAIAEFRNGGERAKSDLLEKKGWNANPPNNLAFVDELPLGASLRFVATIIRVQLFSVNLLPHAARS